MGCLFLYWEVKIMLGTIASVLIVIGSAVKTINDITKD